MTISNQYTCNHCGETKLCYMGSYVSNGYAINGIYYASAIPQHYEIIYWCRSCMVKDKDKLKEADIFFYFDPNTITPTAWCKPEDIKKLKTLPKAENYKRPPITEENAVIILSGVLEEERETIVCITPEGNEYAVCGYSKVDDEFYAGVYTEDGTLISEYIGDDYKLAAQDFVKYVGAKNAIKAVMDGLSSGQKEPYRATV